MNTTYCSFIFEKVFTGDDDQKAFNWRFWLYRGWCTLLHWLVYPTELVGVPCEFVDITMTWLVYSAGCLVLSDWLAVVPYVMSLQICHRTTSVVLLLVYVCNGIQDRLLYLSVSPLRQYPAWSRHLTGLSSSKYFVVWRSEMFSCVYLMRLSCQNILRNTPLFIHIDPYSVVLSSGELWFMQYDPFCCNHSVFKLNCATVMILQRWYLIHINFLFIYSIYCATSCSIWRVFTSLPLFQKYFCFLFHFSRMKINIYAYYIHVLWSAVLWRVFYKIAQWFYMLIMVQFFKKKCWVSFLFIAWLTYIYVSSGHSFHVWSQKNDH